MSNRWGDGGWTFLRADTPAGEKNHFCHLRSLYRTRSPRFEKRVWLAKGYKAFASARRTREGIEAMPMIRKGRGRRVAKKDVVAEAKFVAQLFGLAA